MLSRPVLLGKLDCGKDLGWWRFVAKLKLWRSSCIMSNDAFKIATLLMGEGGFNKWERNWVKFREEKAVIFL